MELRSVHYEVILGVFSIEYNAKLVAREAAGYGVQVEISEKKGRFYVCAGCFDNEKTAFDILNAVKNTGYVFAYIRKEYFC